MQDAKTTEFVKASECINNKNKKDLMIASEKELISSIQMLAVSTNMKWEDRLHQACCAASYYRTKNLKDIEPDCSKYKPVFEDMLNSMVGELLETACPEQNRLHDICSKLPKLVITKEWKAVSLTSAALDLILSLSEKDQKN